MWDRKCLWNDLWKLFHNGGPAHLLFPHSGQNFPTHPHPIFFFHYFTNFKRSSSNRMIVSWPFCLSPGSQGLLLLSQPSSGKGEFLIKCKIIITSKLKKKKNVMQWFELSYLSWNSLIPTYSPAFSKASVWVTTQLNNVVLCSGPREPRFCPHALCLTWKSPPQ